MKRKCDYFVYSAFSSELQDYPYYPFIAKNHTVAINKFINFICNKETVAPGLELHCIGECQVDNDMSIIDGSIQPFLIPYRVESKHNVFSDVYILSGFYINIIRKYLKKLLQISKEEKCKIKHKKNQDCSTVKK